MDDTLPPRRPLGTPPAGVSGAGRRDDETGLLAAPRERVGPYRVEARIGEGGMGKVYRCEDPALGRRVAVKVLHDRYSREEEHRERFLREARALASVRHAAVAEVHAIDRDESGALYIVMELVDGGSVDELLREHGALEVDTAVRIARQVAEGLSAGLRAGLIHRDVKPSNILVDDAGRVKIVDFGLSKEIRGRNSITDDGVVMGTPHYLSPEQGRGQRVDERSDMYALGATFYHMLVGRPPFEGESQISVIVAHVESDPAPPHEIRTAVPRSVSAVVGRLMARAPEDRYASYEEAIDDLRRLEEGRAPLHARLESGRFGAHAGPTSRRRVRTLLVAALLLATVAVAAWWARPDPPGAPAELRGLLGPWYVPRNGPGATLLLDFSTPPPELATPLSRCFEPFSSAPLDGPALEAAPPSPPAIVDGRLVWESWERPITAEFDFERLDEVFVEVVEQRGAFHLELAVEAPLGPRRRVVALRLDATGETAAPLEARRDGEVVESTAAWSAAPRVHPPYRLRLATRPGELTTLIEARVERMSDSRVLWSTRDELPGSDWARGKVSLRTAAIDGPFRVVVGRLAMSGIVRRSSSWLE